MKRIKGNNHHPPEMKNPPIKEQLSTPADGNVTYALAFIILVSIISYLPVFHNSLLNWDDEGYIKNNPLIFSINLKEIFSHNVLGNWHPITILTLALEYQFFGLNPAGYHSVNLLLHLLNVILVFYAVFLVSDKAIVALVSSLLFGIHPLHVESVAWAAELKDLLYTFFFLASYIFYLKYLGERIKELRIKELKNMKSKTSFHSFIFSFFHLKSTSAHQHISTSSHYYCLALILFTFSLLSKAMAASLPMVLLLTDYFKGRKVTIKTMLEKAPFFLLAIIFGVVAIVVQKSTGTIGDATIFTIPERLVFASYGFITYLFKLVFPLSLSAFYPYPLNKGVAYVPAQYYAYALSLLGLAAYVIYSRRFSKKIIFGMGFFTLTVVLVLQLLPVGKAIMADRYSYIPSIGIFYLAGEGFLLLWNKRQKLSAIILLSVFSVFFSVRTYARCGVWENDMTLWNNVIDQYKTVANPYNNRGVVFASERRSDEAIKDFNKAIELKPNLAEAYYNRGTFFVSEKRNVEAIKDFTRAIELKPNYAEAYNNRGIVFANEKRNDEAIQDFNKAIELRPDNVDAYNNRGFIFMNEKRNDEALKDFNKAIELRPGNAAVYNNKANLFYEEKRYEEAISIYTRVIALDTHFAPAYYKRGLAEFYSGKKAAACLDLKQALSLGYKPAEGELLKICD